MKVSVIIPTLNERAYLPRLLQALAAQTRPPDEVIVADANSVDGTAELARQWGARVVSGGMPAVGRNAGARHAQGEVLLFLDADVCPPPLFLARALDEFARRHLDVATSLYEPLEEEPFYRFLTELSNFYLQVMASVSPHAPGFCIFARREMHERIGGFDESLVMAEDHDYVRRAARYGRFGILREPRLAVSMRRLEKEGLLGLAFKYLWCELHALAGRPIHSIPFEYEFGAFSANATRRMVTNVSELRLRLGRLVNPLYFFSPNLLEAIRSLLEEELSEGFGERLRMLLPAREVRLLQEYLERRMRLLRRPRALRRAWSRWRARLGYPGRALEAIWFARRGKDERD